MIACNAGDRASSPGLGRSLEKGMATHSSILAWRSPWTEKPGGLQSMGSQRVRHNWTTFSSLQRRFMKHFLWAAFKELIILWKRRHVYKTRQSEWVQQGQKPRCWEGLISSKAPSRAGLICALPSAFSLVASWVGTPHPGLILMEINSVPKVLS